MIRRLLAALALLALPSHGAEIAGVNIPETVNVSGQPLRLNGAGLRQKAFFKIYVAALYLPAKQSAAEKVMSGPGPKRISMLMMRDVTASQLIEALGNGVRDNHSPAELEQLRPRVETLNRIMSNVGQAKSGSLIALDYIPASGTHVAFNGAPQGAPIPGEDFYQALLKIWLGDDPADAHLKKALLGAP